MEKLCELLKKMTYRILNDRESLSIYLEILAVLSACVASHINIFLGNILLIVLTLIASNDKFVYGLKYYLFLCGFAVLFVINVIFLCYTMKPL